MCNFMDVPATEQNERFHLVKDLSNAEIFERNYDEVTARKRGKYVKKTPKIIMNRQRMLHG